jgi:NitT/TauT family transport system substrate-binding protein
MMAKRDLVENIGVDLQWRLFGTGPAIVDALEKGELDMAYIGLPPAIIGVDRGVPIKCVAGGHIEGTVISSKKQYKGFSEGNDLGDILKQFCGLKIGVPGKGSIHDVIITECLKRFSLNKKIKIVNYKWADDITEAVGKDEISAAVGTPALAVAIKRYACGKILYPPSLLWPYNPSYGILVDSGFLSKESGIVERFLIKHEEANDFLRNRTSEAAKHISDYVGFIDEDFVLDILKVSPKYCAQITDEYIASTVDFVKALKRLGYIAREFSIDEIFDISLIRKIHHSKDHYGDGISVNIDL